MIKFSITGNKREIDQFCKLMNKEVKYCSDLLDIQFPDAYHVQDCNSKMVAVIVADLVYFDIQKLRHREFFNARICMEKDSNWRFTKEAGNTLIKSTKLESIAQIKPIANITAFPDVKPYNKSSVEFDDEGLPILGEFDDVEHWEHCLNG